MKSRRLATREGKGRNHQESMTSKLGITLEGSRIPLERALAYNRSLSKRALDLSGACLGLLVLFPLFLVITAAIRLDSDGPVFFKQKRVGARGKIFEILKFRTMKKDADMTIHQQHIQLYAHGLLSEEDGYKYLHDPRITRVGAFLRKTSLDELPQLLNVLKGEMSIVGPRPVPIYEADLHNLWQNERMDVLPGITGLWQVTGRSSVSMPNQIRLDIRYVRNQSLIVDIKIILATIFAAISTRGAG